MTTQKTFEMVAEIWASQQGKKYSLLGAPKSGILILDRNKPSKINQVNVTKCLCQGEGHTKLTASHADMDRQNELQCRSARGTR